MIGRAIVRSQDGAALASGSTEALLGGKGAALLRLSARGFPVPHFFCLTVDAVEALLEPVKSELVRELDALVGLDARSAEVRAAVEDVAQRVRVRLLERGLSTSLRAELASALAQLTDAAFVAVRSSAVGEDSAVDSFAGQLDTFLWVPRAEVETRVLECVASAFGARALLYRLLRGLEVRSASAAVVVQSMVDARAAGVAFTADPTSGARDVVLVSAGLGLGEGIVAGLVETDTFRLRKRTGEVLEVELATKTRRVERAGEKDTHVVEVPEGERTAAAISDATLQALRKVAEEVEAFAGKPQDIEWAVDGQGALKLLQARPITALEDERVTVFDNSNIVESYPSVTTPLTFSFVRMSYEKTFREAARMFGFTNATLTRERALFANLVGLVDGRIYYNIMNWYRLYQLVGMDDALPAWERAMGLDGSLRKPLAITRWDKLKRTPEALNIRLHIASNVFKLGPIAQRYLDTLDEVRTRVHATDLDKLGGHALVDLLDECTERLLAPYAVAVCNDFYAQQLYDWVEKLVERWGLGDPAAIRDALVVGEADIHSIKPVEALLAIAEQIKADAEARALFEAQLSAAEVLRKLNEPKFSALRAALDRYVAEFGDRTVEELELETPSIADHPSRLVPMLRNALRAERRPDPAQQQRLRAEVEAEVRARLAGHPLRQAAFERAVSAARRAVVLRENLRLARTRAFGIVKRLVRALGALFVRRRVLASADDVFYLTLDEVIGAVRGHSVTRDLAALVALRRNEWAAYKQKRPAPHHKVRGIVAAHQFAAEVPTSVDCASDLTGQGCSAGEAEAEACVVLEPSAPVDVRGRILVAPMTDPGWVFLMVAAKGLVVEKGSLLSHTAIIGRELGLPTVVGVKDASRRIHTGDRIAIDGRRGTVRIVNRKQREESEVVQ